jgi:deoxyinosine 3'endonuclease (endonuclease V)
MDSREPDRTSWELEQIEGSYRVYRSWLAPSEWRSKESLRLAGVDVAENDKVVSAALYVPGKVGVVAHYPKEVVPPYVPAFLAYREAPLLQPLVQRHAQDFDVLLVDGNGILHPRRCGLASALGVSCGVRTIGVAKSYHSFTNMKPSMLPNVPALLALDPSLVRRRDPNWSGELHYHHEQEIRAAMEARNVSVLSLMMRWHHCAESSSTAAQDASAPFFVDEVLGAAIRTGRHARRPIYVSIGHGIDLERAVALVSAAAQEYRLPEPLRMADQMARGTRT